MTRFTQEILEHPVALSNLVESFGLASGKRLLMQASEEILSASRVIFTGMGTSLYAPYLILRDLQNVCSAVEITDAGELLHFGLDSFQGDELVVAISQSGESVETRQVVQKLKGKSKILSIVNDESSFMGRRSDLVLPIYAGEEATISTKTYTNTLALLLILAISVRQADMEAEMGLLKNIVQLQQTTMPDMQRKARIAAYFLHQFSCLHLVARGTDLVTTQQLALIAKEGAGLFTESLSAGLFRHGPIELAGPGHCVLFFVSQATKPELTVGLARETAKLGSRVIAVSDSPREAGSPDGILLELPLTKEAFPSRFFPLICAPFMEYFVHEVALKKGKEAGQFRYAQKITDQE